MTKDPKCRFLIKLEQMAVQFYRQGDSISHDGAWEKKRSFIWGYGDAGKTINLVTEEEIQQTIDSAHERFYSESRVSRIERFKPIRSDSDEVDWDAFAPPAYERRSGDNKIEPD